MNYFKKRIKENDAKFFANLTAFLYNRQTFGADLGFDGISEVQGARRGAVGLVNKPQKIVANDEQYALAA